MATPSIPKEVLPTPAPVQIDASRLVRASFKSAPADTQPCNWILSPVTGSDDQITALNSVSGSTFEGTIVEFNLAIKGL